MVYSLLIDHNNYNNGMISLSACTKKSVREKKKKKKNTKGNFIFSMSTACVSFMTWEQMRAQPVLLEMRLSIMLIALATINYLYQIFK